MASLLSKDSYIQNLGRKVCMQQNAEPRKRKLAPNDGAGEQTHPKKKKKKPRKSSRRFAQERDTRSVPQIASLIVSQAEKTAQGSFSAVDILRKRLQEKIRESRGQASRKGLSAEESEKRLQRRKQERERKKRKRKEMKMKASQDVDQEEEAEVKPTPQAKDKEPAPLVFNKVEVHDEPLNKVMRKKEKKEQVKGNITPLTGKNYKQLLSRLEMRNNKLEELREKDERKAQEMESKIKWTNVLYKAEGVKIKDDEGMLKKALKRKEKQREQRKKRWDGRIEHTAERMQKRQDKRQRNIQKKKTSKLNKKKNRARKKGRILPEDLSKA